MTQKCTFLLTVSSYRVPFRGRLMWVRERLRRLLAQALKAPAIIGQTFPGTTSIFLYASAFAAFLFMVLLTLKPLQGGLPRVALLDSLTYWVDPLLLQGLSLLYVLIVASHYSHIRWETSYTSWKTYVYPIWVLLLVLLAVGLEKPVFKASFLYNRPASMQAEPFFTALVRQIPWISRLLSREEGTAAPSGFVLRQTLLFLSFLLLAFQKTWGMWRRKTFIMVNILILLFVAFSRVYRASHGAFDIGLGMAIGTFLFWLFYLVSLAFIQPRSRSFLTDFSLPAVGFTFSILFYCQETSVWLGFSFGSLLVLGIVHLARYGRVTK